jgi:hypothetical protein
MAHVSARTSPIRKISGAGLRTGQSADRFSVTTRCRSKRSGSFRNNGPRMHASLIRRPISIHRLDAPDHRRCARNTSSSYCINAQGFCWSNTSRRQLRQPQTRRNAASCEFAGPKFLHVRKSGSTPCGVFGACVPVRSPAMTNGLSCNLGRAERNSRWIEPNGLAQCGSEPRGVRT